MKAWHKIAIGLGAGAVLVTTAGLGLDAAERAFPPPLDRAKVVSAEVLDAEGALLRAFATTEGRWRLQTTIDDVDPRFIRMLVAYEDKRFFDHVGIDPVAVG